MMIAFSYFIWNVSPEIYAFTLPFFDQQVTIRWYGVLFALGFVVSQQVLYFIYRKENKPDGDVDILTLLLIVAALVGARLGHILFYELDFYLEDPVRVFEIWNGGLASHGAAIGILLALWFYARRGKPGQSYLQVVDRIVILAALAGAFIRVGNYFNSEIIGTPTQAFSGVVFAWPVTDALFRSGRVEDVAYVKMDSTQKTKGSRPVKMLVDFNDRADAGTDLKGISLYDRPRNHIDFTLPFEPKMVRNETGKLSAIVSLYMIPRHPAQLYEAISCFLLFILLLGIWHHAKEKLPPGRLLGIFLVVCFGLRFMYEFVKEPQEEFEREMILNMGQLLSLPLVVAGIVIWIRSYRKVSQPEAS